MLQTLIDWILHLDTHLAALASAHGVLVYGVLFGVIFVETGVVVLPFLPGDSLLFVTGALAAQGSFPLPIVVPLLIVAAIAGDAMNFAAGGIMRRQAVDTHRLRFIKADYIERTEAFFDQHGKKTIVLARFVPIVRTLAPFVAALSNMPYKAFFSYNVIGAVAWVSALIGAGYAFGSVAWVGEHLTLVLLGIVALSILPGLIGWLKNRPSPSTLAEK
jgi:membrane-associated protein